MTIETKVISLAQAIGLDVKTLRTAQGDLTSLSTTAKGSLAAAINELFTALDGAGASINDVSGNGDTLVVWSANKVYNAIEAAKVAVKSDLTGAASAAYDTFVELQALIEADETLTSALSTAVTNRVRYDAAQTLSLAQQLTACTNIGVGDPAHDFAADYSAAKV